MADNPTAQETAAEKPASPGKDDEKFPLQRVIDEADQLELDRATLIGAFHGVGRTRQVTIKQVRDRVQKWTKGEVKPDTEETID